MHSAYIWKLVQGLLSTFSCVHTHSQERCDLCMIKSVPCTIACFHSLIAEFNRPREFTNASSNDINCKGRVLYEKQWSSGRSGVWYLEFQIVSLGSSGIIHLEFSLFDPRKVCFHESFIFTKLAL